MEEVCPHCGRKFKRLKTHLNHCKMAPVATSAKSVDQSRDAPLKAITTKGKRSAAGVATPQDRQTSFSLSKSDFQLDLRTKSKSKKSVKGTKSSVRNFTPLEVSSSLPLSDLPVKVIDELGSKLEVKKIQGRSKTDPIAKVTTIGKITLAADILRRTATEEKQRDVKLAKIKKESKVKASALDSHEEEKELKGSLTPNMLSMPTQVPIDRLLNKLHSNSKQKQTLSNPKQEYQMPLQRDMEADQKLQVKSLMSIDSKNSGIQWEVVKTSVWDHIRVGLVSRKYNVPMTVSFTETKLSVSKPSTLNSALNLSLPQSIFTPPHSVRALERTVPISSNSRSTQAVSFSQAGSGSTQGLLVSQVDTQSSMPRSLDWMSAVTAGYHGMEVYQPPGRSSLSLEHDWVKSPSLPPAIKPLPVPLIERKLGDVMMRELPSWLADRIPQSPQEGMALLKNGWQWYYRRYIDVRKGGIGGIAMLLTGYCLISYVWTYPHLKHERWRKYH